MSDRPPPESVVSSSLPASGRAREGFPIVAGQFVTPSLKKQRSRELRREQTPAEYSLWGRLRAHRLGNAQFRRQQVIAGWIVDFYCAAARLVLEVDGPIHQGQVDQDISRDAVLEAHGVRVIRFTNDEVLRDLPAVIARIGAELTPPSPSPTRGGKRIGDADARPSIHPPVSEDASQPRPRPARPPILPPRVGEGEGGVP